MNEHQWPLHGSQKSWLRGMFGRYVDLDPEMVNNLSVIFELELLIYLTARFIYLT